MYYEREEVMIKRLGFLGFLASLFVILFSNTSFAAGYSCSKKYTSCSPGYYMSNSSGVYNGTPAANNKCTICPAGGYCPGGTSAPQPCPAGTHRLNPGGVAVGSCAVCGDNQYSSAGATYCLSCNTDKGYGNTGSSALDHAGVASCKVICPAGQYVQTAGGGCVSVGDGYYTSSSVTVAQNKTSSRNACSALSGVSVSGGVYHSVSPYNASTTCTYTAPSKSISNCSSVTTNTVTYNGSSWPATTYSISANVGYYISGNNTASASCQQCSAGSYCVGGTSAAVACAIGSYSNAGASSCIACQDGKTTTLTGQTSCNATCANSTGASSWTDASWSANTVTNKCAINTCSAGYTKSGSANSSGTTSYSCSPNCNAITLNNTERGGSGGTTTVYKRTGSTTWYSDSSCSKAITSITKPSKTNATYAGTYTTSASSGGTQCIAADGTLSTSTSCNVSSATTWYARYNCNTNYTGSGTNISGACTGISLTITLNKNGGTGNVDGSITCIYGSVCALPSGLSKTGWSFTGWGTSTTCSSGSYSMTFTSNTTLYACWSQSFTNCQEGKYYNGTSHVTCPTGSYCPGTGATQIGTPGCSSPCPSNYPNSEAGASLRTQCYSNTKPRPWTGNQVEGPKPNNCYSVTSWKSCSIAACNYVAYSNNDGTGDGTIKSGCQTNNANCPMEPNDVTAASGYYVSGTSCLSCSGFANGFYPNSKNGNTGGQSACYTMVSSKNHIATKYATSVTACLVGEYKGDHNVNYGSISECLDCTNKPSNSYYTSNSATNACSWQCNANFYKNGSSCSSCDSGYTSPAGSTAETACTKTCTKSCTRPTCPDNATCSYGSETSTGTQNQVDQVCNASSISCSMSFSCNEGFEKNSSGTACQRKTYTITLNKNGGTGSISNSITCQHGIACNLPSGLSKTGWNFTGWGTSNTCSSGSYSMTFTSNTTLYACWSQAYTNCQEGKYYNGTSHVTCPAGSYCPGSGSSPIGTPGCSSPCPRNYPNSEAGASLRTQCYSNTKSRPWTGNQVEGPKPNNCYSVTSWKSCSIDACNYVAYSNNDGTGDGTIKSGCPTNNANCVMAPNEVTAASGYYVSGTSCLSCSGFANGFYPNSDNGNTGGQSACRTVSLSGQYVTTNATSATNCEAGTFKGAHTVNYGSNSSCAVCATNTYSDAKAASCQSCNTGNGYGNSGTSATNHAGVASCKVTCSAGQYVPTAGGGCVSVGNGYYTSNSVTVAQNATSSRNACSSLNGVSVSGGTYTSVSPYNAATTCRYTAPDKEITGCSSVTTNTIAYTSSGWQATTYAVLAKAGYIIANNNTASATCSQCNGAVWSSGGSTTSCNSCPERTSGWTRGTGAGWESYSRCYQTKPATSVSDYCSSGQLQQFASSATKWDTASVSITFNAKPGAYVNGTGAATTCSQCIANNYCPGGTTTMQSCASFADGFYPNSGAGSASKEDCFTNSLSGQYVTTNATSATNCEAGTFKGAHTVNYGSNSSCAVCATNTYSDAKAASCQSCNTGNGYGNSGTSATNHAGVASCKVTCSAGQYVPTAGGGCVSVGNGYYTSNSVTVAQNATSSRNACSSLNGVSVSGGTYTSVSPYNAATTCRYTAPDKEITGCSSVTTNTIAYTSSGWQATTYAVLAKAGYMIADNNTPTATCNLCTEDYYCPGGATDRQACSSLAEGFYPNSPAGSSKEQDCYTNPLSGAFVAEKHDSKAQTCDNWTWKSSHTVNYGSISACSDCPPLSIGWVKGTGVGWTSINSCYQTRNATVISPYCQAGQLKQTGKSLTEWNPAEVSITFEALLGSIVTGNAGTSSCQACPDKTYSDGGTNRTCNPCPVGSYCDSGVRLTCPDGGTSLPESYDITQCYKENLEYIASKGKGTKTCYYNPDNKKYDANCKDFEINYCNGGYYLAQPTDIDCVVVGQNYYSAESEIQRYSCPDGGVTNIDTATNVYLCYKANLDYFSKYGQGKQACFYNSGQGEDAIYDRDCTFHTMLYCDAGYYYDDSIIVGECLEAGYGYYSKENLLTREKCPNNGLTLTSISKTAAECYLEHLYCPIVFGQGEQICNYDEAKDSYTLNCQTCYVTSCDETYSQVGNTCIMCPINNVCFDLKQETCQDLTEGTHPFSDEGTTSVDYCYDTCDITENATNMQGRDYFGIADTCEITQCNAKYYLNDGVCDICPQGNYCDGSLPNKDIKSCASLGDGSWKYSAEGSDKPTQCYRACEAYKIEGGTAYPYNKTEQWPTNCSYYGISDSGNACDIIDGKCVEKGCKYDQEKVDGVCMPCNREHALTYKAGGNCLVATCENGWHPNGKQCESDIKVCSAPDAIYAEQVWNSKNAAFSPCMIKECEPDFHISSNACVPNVQVCSVEHGTGIKEWNEKTSTWGECQPTSCEPGYTSERMDTDEPNKPCGRCKNRFSTLGEIAVSTYVRECEIASCLYQGELYNLENNECVPICETRSDETGTQYWDDSRKRCVRTCNDGYTMW